MENLIELLESDKEEDFYNAFKILLPTESGKSILEDMSIKGFFTAPASAQYHGACKYGLAKHSLAVHSAMFHRTLPAFGFSELTGKELEDATIAALFHDACKVGLYKVEQKWRKDSKGKWESYDGYVIDKDLVQIPHGPESLRRIERFHLLSEPWANAVAWHMGSPETFIERQQYYKAVEAYPEVLALHTADVYASFIMGY